jgi:hypothetical protein
MRMVPYKLAVHYVQGLKFPRSALHKHSGNHVLEGNSLVVAR